MSESVQSGCPFPPPENFPGSRQLRFHDHSGVIDLWRWEPSAQRWCLIASQTQADWEREAVQWR